jgi:hypothetical protein
MKKVLFVVSMFQVAVLAAQVSPAFLQLGARAPLIIPDVSPCPSAAAAVPEDDRFAALVAKAIANGTHTDYNEVMPASRYLTDIAGPMDGPHTADYFSVWGYGDAGGPFGADNVTLTSENWEITPEGNWRISQWIHWLDLEGAPTRVQRTILVENMQGHVLDWRMEAVAVGEPRVEESRKAIMAKWYLFTQPRGR